MSKGIQVGSKIYEESVYSPTSHINHVFHMLREVG